jgi:hypothetical protein
MPFPIENQEEDLWCWAAISNSVDHYFNPQSRLTQCTIANTVLRATNCCGRPRPDSCNQAETLQSALNAIGRLTETLVPESDFSQGTFKAIDDFQGIQNEIDHRRPVCVRIQWFGGTKAHFVAICGYKILASGERIIDVADPFYGQTANGFYFGIWSIDFDQFPRSYQGGGEWTATFLVQAKNGEVGA